MIKCVIYDLDDTLYDFKVVNEPAFAKMCEEAERRFGISAEKFGEVFASAYRGIGDRMPEEILELEPAGVDVAPVHSRTLRINYTLEKLGLPLFPHVLDLYDIYWDYILEHMQKEPYIEEVMQELKRRGIKKEYEGGVIRTVLDCYYEFTTKYATDNVLKCRDMFKAWYAKHKDVFMNAPPYLVAQIMANVREGAVKSGICTVETISLPEWLKGMKE